MRISVRWLRQLCPVQIDDDAIARTLTHGGLEVEGRETRAVGPGVVAARVVSCKVSLAMPTIRSVLPLMFLAADACCSVAAAIS